MTYRNQKGQVIVETQLFDGPSDWDNITQAEVHTAIGLILTHLGCRIIRTNATKSGDMELKLLSGFKNG